MTKPDTIRWGISGTGTIARQFARDIRHAKGAQLTAVAARDPAKARNFAAHYQAVADFASLEAMIASKLVDAIYIATTNTVHHAQALACIEKGVPVLIEKPMTTNLAQAREICQAARSHRVFAMEALWSRYLPAMQAARTAINNGAIGKIRRLEADLAWAIPYDRENRLFNTALGGGVLHDLGVYPLSLARFFLGEPHHMESEWHAAPSGADISARLKLSFAADVQAALSCGFDRNGSNRMLIEGDQGVIVLGPPFIKADGFSIYRSRKIADLAHPGGNSLAHRARRKLFKLLPLPGTQHHPCELKGSGLEFEIEAASNAIRLGRLEEPDNTLNDTLKTLEIIDKALAQEAGKSHRQALSPMES